MTIHDLEKKMAEEIKKPRMARNVMPMIDHYCPDCRTVSCSSGSVTRQCPLAKVKWDGVLIPLYQWRASQGVDVRQEAPSMTTAPETPKTPREEQFSLF